MSKKSSSSDSSDEEDSAEEEKQANEVGRKRPKSISSHSKARNEIKAKMRRLTELLNVYKYHDYEGFLEATMKKP